ncbi:PKD1L1 isoform 2 [Pan troglodytes]|uniref:Polycystin-1-like protein 1 n=1 Tax=Pan troglodytes TaxID=9598 RepID=A0A2J8L975_PANTR|nr:PKD1L1 isoform 2 [Pan troglodytes]
MAEEAAQNISDDQERCLQAACCLSFGGELSVSTDKSWGLHLCSCSPPGGGLWVEVYANHVLLMSDGKCGCPWCALNGKAEDRESQSPSSSASRQKNIWKTTSEAALSVVNEKTQAPLDCDNSADSSHGLPPGIPRTPSFTASQSGSEILYPPTQHPPVAILARNSDNSMNPVLDCSLEMEARAPPNLGFRVHMASGEALCLMMDFGDSSGVEMRLHNMSEAMVVTAYHQYSKEGVYMLKAVIYNEFHGTEVELGPYYVEIGHEAVSAFMNSSSVHEDEVLVFADSQVHQKSTVVIHHFPSIPSYNVSFISQTQVGDSQAWHSMTVWYKMQSVSVYTNGTVFATDTDIIFTAVTKETIPLEFEWYFGEDPPVRTTSRSIKKRLSIPQWYRVTVKASNRISSVVSEPHIIRVQKKIVANRLTSPSSALVNASVAFECWINFGTDVAYLWDFGDGTISLGSSSSSHVYSREGEFTVEVLAFNNVSASTLRQQLFIVCKPCQPPLVKNMGPGKVQVQIEGSVVYSNYCVGLEVRAQAPVSVISEGTHLFFSRTTSSRIVLRGTQSFDPDNPGATLRYHWECATAGSPAHPCFDSSTGHQVDAAAPTVSFEAQWLSDSYDQFLVMLRVSSGGRNSSEARVFLSPYPDSAFRFVHISWVSFKDTFVNWNDELSLQAMCEDCSEIPNLSYSWDLFLVNATEKNRIEDFEAYYSDIQEAIPSGGRQPAKDTSFPGSGPSLSAEESPGDGDNLLDPSLSAGRAEPVLMIDWPKALLGRAVFQGYSSSGITEQTVTIKPYSLSSGETYVLQVSVASKHGLLGKAQLYLTVNPAPRDMACQVQPHHGLEAHTVFSVFCMSGKPDFHYEFSYQIGNTSKHTLYHGRDTQYYFVLPAGEHLDNYKVMVSTEITDGEGSKVQPCTVVVTVLPRYHGNDCLGEDLYNSSLKNLSTLQLMGSYTEIRNYITVITRILSRLSKEDKTASCNQWSRIQDALISSVCKLAFVDQEEMIGSVLMLRDLVSFSNKLGFMSAVLILKYTRALLAQGQFSGPFVVDKGVRLELIGLISRVWEVSEQENSKEEVYLHEEGITVISDLLLGCLSLNHVSTGQMEFRTLLHYNLQSSVQSLGSVQVHLPGDLAGHNPAGAETQSPCYISQLILFKKNPYPGSQAPGQIGGVVGLNLYTCSSRRPINRQWLRKPVMVEFGEEDGLDNRRNKTTFVLLRDEVNLHQFTELSENPQESLRIEIEFSKPVTRAFPVMLLVRFSEKPTPSDFLVKQIYFWDESIVQIYIPAASQKDASVGYLSLLDADYDRKPPKRYLAKAVNYTVHFQWIRCLFWDKREWKSERFSPQPGTSPEKVNCSYHRLAAFALLRRKLKASFEVSDISKLQSHPENLLPSIFIMGSVILYGFLVAKSRQVDHHEKKKAGYIFLQEASLPGHQLYAVVIDTGFRAPARLTSKVYIVLCGDNGLSETKELSCPEKPLFERNSRHTFILSAPAQLGLLRKIRLWHDSRGPSPGWFISHVMVKELHTGQAWFFPAQCWLSAGRHDGRVERELTCLQGGLGFRKLFYCKFTEYLEDFHVWLSVYSRPSSSRYLHTPRLTVSFSLLCVYACLTALVAAGGQEQPQLDVSPTLGSFRVGLLCTLLASPGAQLLSLLFRLSKVLAARQQARHLRWAHPPSKAQLRGTRQRMRRESRTRAALRDISMDILMLLLLLCVIYGRFSQDEYSLNQAIQKEFTRNARNSLGGLRNIADWWDWSLTTLLDGLYPGGTPSARVPGAQPPRPFAALIEDSIPTCSPEVGGPEDPYLIDPENQNMTLNGPGGCGAREDCVLSLGRTRTEAHTALSRLRASMWIDRSTRAVSVHFTLYNPPTQLFTSVSLRVEILPTGSLVPSSLVESFSIFRSDSALQYHLMLPQLVFLALSLIHLCVQLYRMMDKGVLSYWRKPRNWLELSVVGVSLTYYAVSGHLVTLAGDVTDQFHRGLCRAFMDLTLMASWNQRARWLRGILLFLFTLKCVYLPGIQNTMASCSSMMRHSLPSIFVAGLRGFLMTLPQKRKSFQSKSFVRLKDITAYMWENVLTFLRLETPKLEEAEMVENHNYYLDEFANLLDELLMKINGLSDSLQLPLLEKTSNNTGEARTEESPLVDISSYQAAEVRPCKIIYVNFLHSNLSSKGVLE